MEDVRTVSAELHRLAETDEPAPFDAAALLERGRRGRRRRQLFTLGGTVAGVAAIALAASLLPSGNASNNKPLVSGDRTQSSLFEPVPGVPSGEAGAGLSLTKEEATRRCALRHPDIKNPLQGTGRFRSGNSTTYEIEIGERFATCVVPGGDKPTAALSAAAAKDPVPATAAGQLRNCSVLMWVDLTNWRVVASDQSKRLATTSLVAISPSGRKAVACQLQPSWPGMSTPNEEGNSQFITLGSYTASDPVVTAGKGSEHADLFAGFGGGGGYCPAKKCTKNYSFTGWGRVASNATRVRLQLGPDVHDVPVTDGWFAFTYVGNADQSTVKSPKLTAYDASGAVVKVIRN